MVLKQLHFYLQMLKFRNLNHQNVAVHVAGNINIGIIFLICLFIYHIAFIFLGKNVVVVLHLGNVVALLLESPFWLLVCCWVWQLGVFTKGIYYFFKNYQKIIQFFFRIQQAAAKSKEMQKGASEWENRLSSDTVNLSDQDLITGK